MYTYRERQSSSLLAAAGSRRDARPYNTSMTPFPPKSFGVLMVGHGTRDVRGQREFLQAAEMLPATLPQAAIGGGKRGGKR